MRGVTGVGFPEPMETSKDRIAILKLWDSRMMDTADIAEQLHRYQYYIERQLHVALDLRRAIKSSLGKGVGA